MKRLFIFLAFCHVIMINDVVNAQCNGVRVQLVSQNSTCPANGSIKIKFVGTGANFIRTDTTLIKIEKAGSGQTAYFKHYDNDSITDL